MNRRAIACPPLAGAGARGAAAALAALLDAVHAARRAGAAVTVVPACQADAGPLRAVLPPGVGLAPARPAAAADAPGLGALEAAPRPSAWPRTWHLRHALEHRTVPWSG